MSVFTTLRRFLRQQHRQWLRGSYAGQSSHGRVREHCIAEDKWDLLSDYDEPPTRRSRRDRRRKQERADGGCNRYVAIAVYVSVAVVLAGHITGKRPLKILQENPTRRVNSMLKDVKSEIAGDDSILDSRSRRESSHVEDKRRNAIADNGNNVHLNNAEIGTRSYFKQDANSDFGRDGEQGSDHMNERSVKYLENVASFDTLEAAGGKSEASAAHGGSQELSDRENTANIDGDDSQNSRSKLDGRDRSLQADDQKYGTVRDIDADKLTTYCYVSGVTNDALCVHTPICAGSHGIIRISTTLKCAPCSNSHGILEPVSPEKCTEIEHDVEHRADLSHSERQSEEWLQDADRERRTLWFEGETVFLQLTKSSKSAAHYAQRIFFLHHILLHPDRYGLNPVSNIVIVADKEVVRKMKFHKSWHYGLLKAITHPNRPVFKLREIEQLVSAGPAESGAVRVFVASGHDQIVKSKQTTCFRRAAMPGALHGQYLLTQEQYPGVVKHGMPAIKAEGHSPAFMSAIKRGRHFDGAMFRRQVFASMDREEPQTRKLLVYLHRTGGRALSLRSHNLLESALKEVSQEIGHTYSMIDVSSISYAEQVDMVSGAAIAVGVHGTQLMSTMFMSGDAALVEIFPYRFWHDLYRDGCGSGLFYQSISLNTGTDYEELDKYGGLEECIATSRECRLWYRSDDRELVLDDSDAIVIQRMVREAANEVARLTHTD